MMHAKKIVAGALALAFVCTSIGAVRADEKSDAAAKAKAAQDAMMADMMKWSTPGPEHAKLKAFEGKWNATVKSFMGGPEPQVSKGVSENKLIMGGRFLEQRYNGDFMGQKFEGYGLTGYDLKKGELVAFWMDSMSTGFSTQTGSISADGKEWTTKGTMDGPDGKPMDIRAVTKVVDPKTLVYTMYGKMGEQEAPVMEITYTK